MEERVYEEISIMYERAETPLAEPPEKDKDEMNKGK